MNNKNPQKRVKKEILFHFGLIVGAEFLCVSPACMKLKILIPLISIPQTPWIQSWLARIQPDQNGLVLILILFIIFNCWKRTIRAHQWVARLVRPVDELLIRLFIVLRVDLFFIPLSLAFPPRVFCSMRIGPHTPGCGPPPLLFLAVSYPILNKLPLKIP